MKASIRERLAQVAARYEEVGLLLSQPEVFSDQNRFRDLSVEYSQLEPLVNAWREWRKTRSSLEDAQAMLGESEPELRTMAQEEIASGEQRLAELEREIQLLLLPTDPHDDNNIFLEIRAGTGGDEAAIFAGDLFRMYQKYAESRGWDMEILSQNAGEHGGFKEV
ncbi:MAG: PCRF domain-containing protein, partial [Xanthomonadales bacterium]|nr:PCRF domain-containing protein [Xanthomonadales bacterium]